MGCIPFHVGLKFKWYCHDRDMTWDMEVKYSEEEEKYYIWEVNTARGSGFYNYTSPNLMDVYSDLKENFDSEQPNITISEIQSTCNF